MSGCNLGDWRPDGVGHRAAIRVHRTRPYVSEFRSATTTDGFVLRSRGSPEPIVPGRSDSPYLAGQAAYVRTIGFVRRSATDASSHRRRGRRQRAGQRTGPAPEMRPRARGRPGFAAAAAGRLAASRGRARGDVTEHGCEVMATRSARDEHAGALALRHANRLSGSYRARHAPSGRPCALVMAEHGREADCPRAIPTLPRCPPPSPPSMSCFDQPRMRRPSATIALELSAARFAARNPRVLARAACSRVMERNPSVMRWHGRARLALWALLRAHDTPGGLAVALGSAHRGLGGGATYGR